MGGCKVGHLWKWLSLPPKPWLVLWQEVYDLVDGPAEAGSMVEDHPVESEGEQSPTNEEGSSDVEDDWSGHMMV